MSRVDSRQVHINWCDAMVAKASRPGKIYSVRDFSTSKPKGIKTHNMSRAMLAAEISRSIKLLFHLIINTIYCIAIKSNVQYIVF